MIAPLLAITLLATRPAAAGGVFHTVQFTPGAAPRPASPILPAPAATSALPSPYAPAAATLAAPAASPSPAAIAPPTVPAAAPLPYLAVGALAPAAPAPKPKPH